MNDLSFKEEILSFIRELGHTGEIKVLSDVNVNHMHQPWRSFAANINKWLSGKTTALKSLRLSCAQILWGMYHNKNVDYVYLLLADLVFQVENKNNKKNSDMDDSMFTTIRVISKHQDTQVYGAILHQHLTNQAMLESEAYKTYHAYATGEKISKPKYVPKKVDSDTSPKKKPVQAPKLSIAGTTSTEQPPLKDKSMWSDQEKRVQKIDRLARSLLIQGLSNDVYSLIDSKKTAKDLCDAFARHMLGSKYGEQDRKAAVLYEYETFKATEGELLLDTYIQYLQVINDLKKCGYSKDNCELNFKFLNNLQPEWKQYATMMRQNKNLMDINIDALYNILKQNQRDVNDAMGSRRKLLWSLLIHWL
nr:hypothetical protein [Tanacetum cinerariifolium]